MMHPRRVFFFLTALERREANMFGNCVTTRYNEEIEEIEEERFKGDRRIGLITGWCFSGGKVGNEEGGSR